MPLAKCGHTIAFGSKGIRGVCKNCYKRLDQQVKTGKTTWEQLEREGKTDPLAGLINHPMTGRRPRGRKEQ